MAGRGGEHADPEAEGDEHDALAVRRGGESVAEAQHGETRKPARSLTGEVEDRARGVVPRATAHGDGIDAGGRRRRWRGGACLAQATSGIRCAKHGSKCCTTESADAPRTSTTT